MMNIGMALIIAFFMASCTQQEASRETATISASACAKRTADGSVVECAPSSDAEARLEKMMAEMRRIDDENPGPKTPSLDHLFQVKTIDTDGTIHLNSGDSLALAGLNCHHPDYIKYLRVSFLGNSPSDLAFELTGHQSEDTKHAYVWEVDSDFGRDIGNAQIQFGPSTSSVNEVALTSGWCTPVPEDKHVYYARYQRLSGLSD